VPSDDFLAQRADFQRLVKEEVERRLRVNTPRLLTGYSEATEREFAQLVLATLTMMEFAEDASEIAIPGLTMGVLRNHAKWCQVVGATVEQAIKTQEGIQKLEQEILRFRRRADVLNDENRGLKAEIMQVKKDAKTRD
jgi:hypothetical protein